MAHAAVRPLFLTMRHEGLSPGQAPAALSPIEAGLRPDPAVAGGHCEPGDWWGFAPARFRELGRASPRPVFVTSVRLRPVLHSSSRIFRAPCTWRLSRVIRLLLDSPVHRPSCIRRPPTSRPASATSPSITPQPPSFVGHFHVSSGIFPVCRLPFASSHLSSAARHLAPGICHASSCTWRKLSVTWHQNLRHGLVLHRPEPEKGAREGPGNLGSASRETPRGVPRAGVAPIGSPREPGALRTPRIELWPVFWRPYYARPRAVLQGTQANSPRSCAVSQIWTAPPTASRHQVPGTP